MGYGRRICALIREDEEAYYGSGGGRWFLKILTIINFETPEGPLKRLCIQFSPCLTPPLEEGHANQTMLNPLSLNPAVILDSKY